MQEVGDGDREETMEIRKFPREQDDFLGTDERYCHFLFHLFIYLFFLKKIVVHGDFTDQFKLSCPYHMYRYSIGSIPPLNLRSGGKKGKSNLKYTPTQKDFSVLLTFLLL